MKKFYLLFILASVSSVLAQSTDNEMDQLMNAEKKGASNRMAAVINPDTYNYDVTYTKLELTVDPAVFNISGKVTTTYTALSDMATLVFDLARITDTNDPNFGSRIAVTSIKEGDVGLSFTRNDTELIITLPNTQTAGTSAIVEVSYNGAPAGSGFGSFVTGEHDGTPVLWTLSEPFGARDWWPCKQDLNDKIDDGVDVYVTAPSEYTAVSNGLQQAKVNNNNGTSTTHWKHNYAIPAYLVAIAVTNYQIYNQQGGLGTVESPFFPIINYMYPETAAANQASLAPMPDIINFYETKFGKYGFRDEKYGNIQFGWGGGMEHTTGSYVTANGSGGYSRGLIAHELGHQWFGDKVTCGSWKDIWLNEGFATYLNMLVIEHFDGDAAFIANKSSLIDNITSSNGGAVYLTDTEALDVNRIFSSRLSYNKGAMVLNMLRLKMGDSNFFQGLQDYIADPSLAYAYAHTPDLQSHLEAASGQDLTDFFNDWVYNQGFPTFTIAAHNTGTGQAQITISQTQSHPSVSFFEMPVPIRLLGTGGQQQDILLDNTTNGQVFNLAVSFPITGITFNPKKDIIANSNSTAVLATEDFDVTSGISLYPNPANNTLALQLPAGISIEKTIFYNALGQKTKETTSQDSWDVSALPSGMHFINVYTNKGTKQLKFIKK